MKPVIVFGLLSLAVSLGAQDADQAAIMAQGRAFSAAYVANDAAAIGAIYSDSAVLMPPNRTVRGRAAIQQAFTWGPPYRQIAHTMTPNRLVIRGGMAVEEGIWTSTGQRGDAEPETSSERYLLVWVRESDGVWRILYDIWHRPQPAN